MILITDLETALKSNEQIEIFTIDILQGVVDEYFFYKQSLIEAKKWLDDHKESPTNEYEKMIYDTDDAYYTNQRNMLIDLVGDIDIDNDGDGGNIDTHSIYVQLIQSIYNALSSYSNTQIYDKIQEYWNNNTNLWNNLYRLYGNFIYEGKYENSDEMDSVSLYNQATIYYKDYKQPSASYSTSILDLSVLEAIDIPRLSIGSKIKVYNKELNLNEGNSDQEPLNIIQYTNNDLIVTSLSFDLRKSADVTIGVEKIASYQSILQKLIKSIN